MKRFERRDALARLDPETEFRSIYRVLADLEFPWDMNQALSFALFRTYAVPSIGRLLDHTAELTERTQKRYDDTVLILDAILAHGVDNGAGRDALRRMNQMHAAYDISNDDLRYVLPTFVVTPIRWLDVYGWRRMTEVERVASCNYYRELGRHMGIKNIPASWPEFARLLDDYERVHFAYDDGSRRVADSTLALMATFPPNNLAPRALVDRLSYALMDEPLLAAFGYPQHSRPERFILQRLIWLRGRTVRMLPSRRRPFPARMIKSIRSYPSGYDVSELGTRPGGTIE